VVEEHLRKIKSPVIHNFHSWPDEREMADIPPSIGSDDLLAAVSPQRGSISYSPFFDGFLRKLLKSTATTGSLVIYPGVIRS
jgi:hypothetical protein